MNSSWTSAYDFLETRLENAAPPDRPDVLRNSAREIFERGLIPVRELHDTLSGISADFDLGLAIDEIVTEATGIVAAPDEEDFDLSEDLPDAVTASDETTFQLPPLTLEAWGARELQQPDFLLGSVLSTTSRMLIAGPTGIGKTNLAISIAMGVAGGEGFAHWKGTRPRTVLYVDGEMSRRLLRQRLIAESGRRSGEAPASFHALCADDVDDFAPLNTPAGRQFMWRVVEAIGGDVELIVFDNIMSLLAGSMAEEGAWAEVMPFVRSLTRRSIGQVWVHHMGHDAKKAYGTKTREWQLDTVALLEKVERADTDVSFRITFDKARERAPRNRNEFQDVEVALVNDRWVHRFPGQQDQQPTEPKSISPKAVRFLEALAETSRGGRTSDDAWKAACHDRGLIDLEGEAGSARALFSKYRKQLIEANRVGSEGGQSWVRR
ncbi:MAG: AAA family ATPase [Chthoniobacter sp.]|nr:AAA family ATPase [Chthoniobacter sp.]